MALRPRPHVNTRPRLDIFESPGRWGEIHVVPTCDVERHVYTGCWCRPTVTNDTAGTFVRHRSWVLRAEVPDHLPARL